MSSRGGTSDSRFMIEAVRLGEGARGRSAPNPNVGCVVVTGKGEIVGRGSTELGGRPHAEAIVPRTQIVHYSIPRGHLD